MNQKTNQSFFNVVTQPQTYRNLFYLMLSFPLGIVYFVLTITLLATGASLAIIGVGFVLLLALAFLLRGFAAFERQMAESVLGTPITAANLPPAKSKTLFGRMAHIATAPYTWRTAALAILKFPIGIVSFVLSIVLVSIPLGLISTLFLYRTLPLNYGPGFMIDTLPEAIISTAAGILLLPIALNILNELAIYTALVVKTCIGGDEARPVDKHALQKAILLETADDVEFLKPTIKTKQPAM